MNNLSKHKNINNEDPYKLPCRDTRELNVVECIK